jgi:hypothetical protein
MASIEVTDEGGTETDGDGNTVYTVTWTVDTATDMPEEVFLLRFSDNTFIRTITPGDLIYPTTRTDGTAFYRQSEVTGRYDSITDGDTARTNVDAALTTLVTEYNAGLTTFLGSNTNTYS